MNEVRSTQATNPLNTSLKKGDVVEGLKSTDDHLPVAPSPGTEAASPTAQEVEPPLIPPVELPSAVSQVNDFFQSVQRSLHFSVDDETDQTVVRVVDTRSGEVIRQIPEDVFLDLAKQLEDGGTLQFISTHG